MNARKARRINRRTRQLLIEWVQSLLPDEEAEQVTKENIENLLPDETHFFANNRIHLNAYSFKWVKNGIKRVIKQRPELEIENVTMEQIQCSLNSTPMKQSTRYQIL